MSCLLRKLSKLILAIYIKTRHLVLPSNLLSCNLCSHLQALYRHYTLLMRHEKFWDKTIVNGSYVCTILFCDLCIFSTAFCICLSSELHSVDSPHLSKLRNISLSFVAKLHFLVVTEIWSEHAKDILKSYLLTGIRTDQNRSKVILVAHLKTAHRSLAFLRYQAEHEVPRSILRKNCIIFLYVISVK